MLKLPITYTDFNGVEVTETFFFNLSTAEVAEMELKMAGGLTENLQRIGESGDPNLIVNTFKEILLSSFGVRSEDGRLFRKRPEFTADFVDSGAYEVLFVRLITDSEYAAEFVNGIMPKSEDPNAQHLIKAAQDRRNEDRAIPQAIAQQDPVVTDESKPDPVEYDYFPSYEQLHEHLTGLDIQHNFIDGQFFKNLPKEQQRALIDDLKGKVPRG